MITSFVIAIKIELFVTVYLVILLSPAQTINETIKMYTNSSIIVSVDSLPPERNDMKLRKELFVLPF